MSSYSELVCFLPDSVYIREESSNNYKLWDIFAQALNEIEMHIESFRLIRDIDKQSGLILDLIGEILRESREGKDDITYKLYLMVALQKIFCSGSISMLQNVLRLVAGNSFIGVWELTPGNKDLLYSDERVYTDGTRYMDGTYYLSGEMPNGGMSPYETYLDGGFYLDGSFFLSGDVFQPGFIECVFSSSINSDILNLIIRILNFIKPAGVKYRIRLQEA